MNPISIRQIAIEKTKEKRRIAHIGKKHSEKTKKKIKDASIGHMVTRITRQKISAANTGRIHSEKSKKNMSLAHLGNIYLEKTREKVRQAWNKKFPININYFKKLNIRNAYVLGYLFADGSLGKLSNSTGFGLSFSSIDRELINKIKIEFDIRYKQIGIKLGKNGQHDQYHINTANQYFLEHLVKQGMLVGNKQNRISVPKNIIKNKSYFFSFFRGFFDGDGSITLFKPQKKYRNPIITICTASQEFLTQLKNACFKFGIKSGPVRKIKGSRAKKLNFYGQQNVYKLYKFMYKNSDDLFLTRKKKRFEEYFKNYAWCIYNNNGELEWKNGMTYQTLFNYIEHHLVKPDQCPICRKERKIHIFCKKKNKYTKELSQWLYICQSCCLEIDIENTNKKHYFCKICGRIISQCSGKYKKGRCKNCYNAIRLKNKLHFFCKTCEKEISYNSGKSGGGRCSSCAGRERKNYNIIKI